MNHVEDSLLSKNEGCLHGIVSGPKAIKLDFATVEISKAGTIIGITHTSKEGEYLFDSLDDGSYNVAFRYLGLEENIIVGVRIDQNENCFFYENNDYCALTSGRNITLNIRLQQKLSEKNLESILRISCDRGKLDLSDPYRKFISKEQIKHSPW